MCCGLNVPVANVEARQMHQTADGGTGITRQRRAFSRSTALNPMSRRQKPSGQRMRSTAA
jgi:hypothetical protein